jgi:hypothetical protein
VARAARPEANPASTAVGLDAVVGGRTIREWIAGAATGDPASPAYLAARAALRREPEAVAGAIVECLRDTGDVRLLPRLLRWLLPDVRDVLVPMLLPWLDDDATRPSAVSVLLVYADSRGFGPHDARVADAVSRVPLDTDTVGILASLGAALGPVVDRVIRPLGTTSGDLDDAEWNRLAEAAPERAAPLLIPREGAEHRRLSSALEWWLPRSASLVTAVVPSLVARSRQTTDDEERQALLRTLACNGSPEAVAAVVAAARDPLPGTRSAAAAALGECPGGAEGVVATLRVLASDADEDVRTVAYRALARSAAWSDSSFVELAARMGSSDAAVRDAAVEAAQFVVEYDWMPARRRYAPLTDRVLAHGDPAARAALLGALHADPLTFRVRSVDQCLRDPDPRVRAAARSIDSRPAAAGADDLPAWLELLAFRPAAGPGDTEFEDRLADYEARGGTRAALLDALRARLGTQRAAAVLDARSVAEVVERLGVRAAPLLPALAARLDATPHGWDAEPFLRAFASAGGDVTQRVLPHLTGESLDAGWAESCLSLLRAPHLPMAIDALRDARPGVRRAFAWALGRMAEVPPGMAERALVPLLDDPDASVRRAAAAALLRRVERWDLALATLRAELDTWPTLEPDAPEVAADRDVGDMLDALAGAGPIASHAFDVLHRGLRSPVLRAQHLRLLCRALAEMGPSAAAAVPELAALVERRSVNGLDALGPGVGFYSGPLPDTGYVAVAAAEALGAIGGSARPAIPALRTAERSQEWRLRTAATAAIRAIEGR